MHYSEYGSTGKQVSAIGFGGMRFNTSRPEEENADLIHYAVENGITYLDTAPGYCGDRSEAIFGRALRKLPRESFTISTKGMPTSVSTAGAARDLVERSLERLGVETIDFYHVWCLRNMEHFRLAMRPGGQVEGLLRAREDGLIDHIVCSSHQPGHEVRQILEEGPFEGVLLGVNILNFPYRWGGVAHAAALGKGVAAMNPLAGGMIPQFADRLGFLCEEGETPVEAALRFVAGAPEINTALVGFTTREHIDAALRAAEDARPLSEEARRRIGENLTGAMDAICTGCGYCRDCPQKIPVPNYMQFYNRKTMFGQSAEELRQRLGRESQWGLLVGPKSCAGECIECGRCEEACTQHLPIIKRLKEIAAWEKELADSGKDG